MKLCIGWELVKENIFKVYYGIFDEDDVKYMYKNFKWENCELFYVIF